MTTTPTSVEYFFDPACPWTWTTSRWLVDASAATGTEVRWRNLSLAVVNAGREIPERFRAAQQAAARAHRVIAALLAAGRNDLVGDFYTEWGRRFHHDCEHDDPGFARGRRGRRRGVRGPTPSTRSGGTRRSRRRPRRVKRSPATTSARPCSRSASRGSGSSDRSSRPPRRAMPPSPCSSRWSRSPRDRCSSSSSGVARVGPSSAPAPDLGRPVRSTPRRARISGR